MEWDGMGRDGMGWDRMGWDVMGWNLLGSSQKTLLEHRVRGIKEIVALSCFRNYEDIFFLREGLHSDAD